jgi:uncharacterized protein YndB with AHSA1/START domain/DNA-binding MarR family transcriptional regulator
VDAALLAALAEPNRLRIVELLGAAPRAVGEIAAALGLRQPQVTKHLQTLERAGLVTAHRLGRRRIYALRRAGLRDLARWAATFAEDHPSEDVLAAYEAAVADEHRHMAEVRTLAFERALPAPAAVVWHAWTDAATVRQWWHPAHFTTPEAVLDARPGGQVRIVLQEGDGTRYVSAGEVRSADPPHALRFSLAPLDAGGTPLFAAEHDMRIEARDGATALVLTIHVTAARPEAAPAVAGLRPGWQQLLDHLAALVRDD